MVWWISIQRLNLLPHRHSSSFKGDSRVTLQHIVVNIWLFNSILYCFQVIKTFRVITVKHQPFIKLWYYPAPYKVSWTPLPPCLSVCLKSAPLHFIPRLSQLSSFFKTEWFAAMPLCFRCAVRPSVLTHRKEVVCSGSWVAGCCSSEEVPHLACAHSCFCSFFFCSWSFFYHHTKHLRPLYITPFQCGNARFTRFLCVHRVCCSSE